MAAIIEECIVESYLFTVNYGVEKFYVRVERDYNDETAHIEVVSGEKKKCKVPINVFKAVIEYVWKKRNIGFKNFYLILPGDKRFPIYFSRKDKLSDTLLDIRVTVDGKE